MTNLRLLVAGGLLALSVVNCSGGKTGSTEKVALPSIEDVPAGAWQRLSQKKIYFGHQSVGYDVLNGIADIMKDKPEIKLRIVETVDPVEFASPILAHSRVGRNVNPKSKTDDFAEILERGLGEEVDIAFFKFCFIDILPNTDVEKVFSDYKTTMARLRQKFPKTVFIHVTVPLVSNEEGLKGLMKKGKDIVKGLIGKMNYYDNTKRNHFNELMRNEYMGKEALYDLAKTEATYPSGEVLSYSRKGTTQYALIPDYTNDGGHLNEKGRRIAAAQLLVLLAELAE